MTIITHISHRTGETYIIFLSEGEFHHVACHVDGIGPDPIVYDEVEQLPAGVRHDIEQLIAEHTT